MSTIEDEGTTKIHKLIHSYCRDTSQSLVCDSSAAFSIWDANPLQRFLSCASSVILARLFLDCCLIGYVPRFTGFKDLNIV